MIHRYRQILFYSVLVFLFMLMFSMLTEVEDSDRLSLEQRSETSEDEEEMGSGNGEGFHYDRVSDDVTGDDPDITYGDDNGGDGDHDISDDGVSPVRLDTGGPSHKFWPEDAQCSRHR